MNTNEVADAASGRAAPSHGQALLQWLFLCPSRLHHQQGHTIPTFVAPHTAFNGDSFAKLN